MAAGLLALGLSSCGPNSELSAQNARVQEQLAEIKNSLAAKNTKGNTENDIQDIKKSLEDVQKTTDRLTVALSDLKSSQDPKAANEALLNEVKSLLAPMQKQIAELGEKVGRAPAPAPAGPTVADRDPPPRNPNPNPNPNPPRDPAREISGGPKADTTIEVKWPEERGGGRGQPGGGGGNRGGGVPRNNDGPIPLPPSSGLNHTPGNAGPSEKVAERVEVRWPEEGR